MLLSVTTPLMMLMLLLLLLLPRASMAGSVNDCQGVRYAYRDRGLEFRDVPRQPRQGKTHTHTLLVSYLRLLTIVVLEMTVDL